MKKYIVFTFLSAALFFSCDDEEFETFDVDSDFSLATFQDAAPAQLVYNPAADTDNIYTVSVSNRANSDRTVNVSVAATSTIDPTSYEILNLNPVIPAGQFSADIVVTTFASDVFPETGTSLVLTLDGVQGAEIDAALGSIASYSIGFTVECPSVDIAGIVGDGATVLENELLTDGFGADLSAGGLTRTVLAGPGDGQITIVGGVGFNSSEDLILNLDPADGSLSYGGSPDAIFFFNGPDPINYTTATGRALTCIGLIELQIAAPFAAPFDQNTFRIQFQ
ncbi:MAG: hypothetical protein AAF634_04095 [Bacteroidota bacterium]